MFKQGQAGQAEEPRQNGALVFLGELLRSPLAVSAPTPSSKPLARLVTSELEGSPGPVIELGPGTGVITEALLARGIPEARIGLVETGERFCEHLRRTYPEAKTFEASGEDIDKLDFGFDSPPVAVVSGIPLLSIPPAVRDRIVAVAFEVMGEVGRFYQFTYSFTSPVPREVMTRLGLRHKRIGTALANFPPASVFRYWRDN